MKFIGFKFIGVVALILITVSEFTTAGGIEYLLENELGMKELLYAILAIFVFVIIIYHVIDILWHLRGSGVSNIKKLNDLEYNFETYTPDEREKELLDCLNDKNKLTRHRASTILIEKFERLGKNFREHYILIISKDEYRMLRGAVAGKLIMIFDILPADLRNKLIEDLANDTDKDVQKLIIDVIRRNVDKLPERLQSLLLQLADNKNTDVRFKVAEAVYLNFNSLPENLRENLIKRLYCDEYLPIRKEIVRAVKKHRKKLPKKLGDKIINDIEIL